MNRESGVLMHISSLWGDYSCGSFGKEAREFADFLSYIGCSWWQVLPFCMVDECNSPYKSYSAFGGNPYFVDLEILYKKDLITLSELKNAKQKTPYVCEFDRLSDERFALLKLASQRADKEKPEIEEFIKSHIHIAKFCEFMALMAVNGERPWQKWKVDKYNENVLYV